jgi:DMSO/TMAO reductase YedYZ molybdopterin-dependent catalytic subunit
MRLPSHKIHSLHGGCYYDTQSLENVLKPQWLLAIEMNGQPLSEVYGAPLRLRVENQLGYKTVKWIERIKFVESEKMLGQGRGWKERGRRVLRSSAQCLTGI